MSYTPKYFSKDEMTCNCCGELPEGGINEELLEKLDQLREKVGEPVHVTCMYRCPPHNAAVGGARYSQHLYGLAADIYVDGLTVDELADIATDIGFRGVERNYDLDYVHVDVREDTYYWYHENGDDITCDSRGNAI
ncbi:MAG: D-Ala-D-Ala carboxypeptidase family metallohydrolase [Acidaminococcaceae bacterium]|nr:D-Ala-D-Ala carboxypeptidase family metallohydrolase [Acidaminococcaceae bacterium]